MPQYKMSNGIRVEMTAEEITEHEETQAALQAGDQAIADARAAAAIKKASGKQKLKDLGLDDDEIKALTGA